MVQPVRLKLDGKVLDLNPASQAETRLKLSLDKAASDELFTTAEVARRADIGMSTLQRAGVLPDYTAIVGHKRYWGNPKAIAELLRQVKHEGC